MKGGGKNSKEKDKKLIDNCTQEKINLHKRKAPRTKNLFPFVSKV